MGASALAPTWTPPATRPSATALTSMPRVPSRRLSRLAVTGTRFTTTVAACPSRSAPPCSRVRSRTPPPAPSPSLAASALALRPSSLTDLQPWQGRYRVLPHLHLRHQGPRVERRRLGCP